MTPDGTSMSCVTGSPMRAAGNMQSFLTHRPIRFKAATGSLMRVVALTRFWNDASVTRVLGTTRVHWIGFVLLGLVCACSAVPPPGIFACSSNADCPPSQSCSEGVCTRERAKSPAQGRDAAAAMSSATAGSDADAGPGQPPMAAAPKGGAPAAASALPTAGSQPTQPMMPRASEVGSSAAAGASAAAGSPASSSAGAGSAAGPASARLALGSACRNASECESDHCLDYVCCESASCAECQHCGSKGRCENVAAGTSEPVCGAKNMTCDAEGRCALSLGAKCAADAECASAHCGSQESTIGQPGNRLCCDQAVKVCDTCSYTGSGVTHVPYGATVGRCEGNNTCLDGDCLPIDRDQLDYGGAVSTSATGAWAAQTWTVRVTGQIVEVRLIGTCEDLISIHGVSETGAPDSRVLAVAKKVIAYPHAMLDGYSVVRYSIDPGLRVSETDVLALVVPLSSCRVATSTKPATGLWTASEALDWQAQNASMRFMSVLRP